MVASVLLASAAVGTITAFLALLIAITDKIVNNYGEVIIDINQKKRELKVKGGSPLLFSLGEAGIFLPSACGGR